MSNKLILIIILSLAVVLSACGGGLDADDIEDAFSEAWEDDNFDAFNDIACEDDQADSNDSDDLPSTVEKIDCEIDGDEFSCDVDIRIIDEEGVLEDSDMELLQEMRVSGDIEDDKICNLELEMR